ncbi:MAG: hypothetical protein K0R27_1475 [Xanthobacteraceae bacterium]|jgi:hypothetical protein|nr:hypothetical protein [Xanthobacteraceae bacterium]
MTTVVVGVGRREMDEPPASLVHSVPMCQASIRTPAGQTAQVDLELVQFFRQSVAPFSARPDKLDSPSSL